ncbi:MAG TPA: hypothetical protein VKP88_08510 [Candidatus Paceibacterota bacterium]|nr:hypothetical protein [Candidatus Paceibacterota bacterium]
MKHSLIIAGVIIGVAVVAYLIMAQPATAPTEPTPATTEEESEVMDEAEMPTLATGQGTLADFFGRGESVYCTFSGTYADDTTGEGEFWYADERMRVEAITRVDGEVYTSNMINDGQRTYIWSGTADGMQAMVMDTDMTEMSAEYEAGAATDARVDMEQTIEYECQPWTPQAAQFVPPSNLEFIDMNDMMEGMFQGEMRGLPEGMNF